MTEQWLPVVGFEGWYEVSDLGRLRRIAPGRGVQVGRIVHSRPDPKGYMRVSLCRHGKRTDALLARLVATAFHGAPPEGHQCDHVDGDKANNTAANLEWVTASENQRRAYALGLHVPPPVPTKVSDAEVAEIRALAGTEPMTVTAARFGLSAVHILKLQRGDLRNPDGLPSARPLRCCRGCSAPIAYCGKGRPPTWCATCKPSKRPAAASRGNRR